MQLYKYHTYHSDSGDVPSKEPGNQSLEFFKEKKLLIYIDNTVIEIFMVVRVSSGISVGR